MISLHALAGRKSKRRAGASQLKIMQLLSRPGGFACLRKRGGVWGDTFESPLSSATAERLATNRQRRACNLAPASASHSVLTSALYKDHHDHSTRRQVPPTA